MCVCASGDPHTDSFMLPILQHMHTEVNESPALTDRYQQGHLYTVLLQNRIAGRSSNYPGYRVSCQHYIHIKDPNKQQKIHCLYINPPHRLHHPQGGVRGQAELTEHHLWRCLGDDFLCYLSTFCVPGLYSVILLIVLRTKKTLSMKKTVLSFNISLAW